MLSFARVCLCVSLALCVSREGRTRGNVLKGNSRVTRVPFFFFFFSNPAKSHRVEMDRIPPSLPSAHPRAHPRSCHGYYRAALNRRVAANMGHVMRLNGHQKQISRASNRGSWSTRGFAFNGRVCTKLPLGIATRRTIDEGIRCSELVAGNDYSWQLATLNWFARRYAPRFRRDPQCDRVGRDFETRRNRRVESEM